MSGDLPFDRDSMNAAASGPWSRTIPFKVDIAGVIHIMGAALYSRPEAALRELIQNAHDAVVRRRMADLSYVGRIDIEQDTAAGTLEISDDGIGLNAEEAETYLGTLGIGLTGLMKGEHPLATAPRADLGLIGQFGIGLFSAFMLAEELIVTSRRVDAGQAVRWRAGPGTDITLSSAERSAPGTTIRLRLKEDQRHWAIDAARLEHAVKEYADYLAVPIFLNRATQRVNVMHSQWFDPTPDEESLELELAAHFDETPLDVLPIHGTHPVEISGALYVSPERTPGFAGLSVVTATVQRMVVSRRVQDLLPAWAPFVRGVLELCQCRPTASREDLVRNREFELAAQTIEERLYERFEHLADHDPARFESILSWHRYMLAGSALTTPRLRRLLARTYRFNTSQGNLTAREILQRSRANPIFEAEFDHVVWYNTDRRQERFVNSLFASQPVPCVHTVRSFEESLLAATVADAEVPVDLRMASLSSPRFANDILEVRDLEEAPEAWREFLAPTEARILCASFREDQPVMAFLNEKHELMRTFDDLKKQGTVPAAFQRLIDRHFEHHANLGNEVLLNREHRLVARALEQKTSSPLASVLRLLVLQALSAVGAAAARQTAEVQASDLDWIADALWGRAKP